MGVSHPMERKSNRNAKSNMRNNYYVGDNLARKFNEPVNPYSEREARRRQARKIAQIKAKHKRNMTKAVVIGACGAAVVLVCAMLLYVTSAHTQLQNEISSLESERAAMQEVNDSKEYDIESSVNLDEVIKVATEELGMVRSSASQIITYETQDNEYVQQKAEIPTE